MNSTCIYHEDFRPKYIHVQILVNMHKTPYTMGKLQNIHIHLTVIPCSELGNTTHPNEGGDLYYILPYRRGVQVDSIQGNTTIYL